MFLCSQGFLQKCLCASFEYVYKPYFLLIILIKNTNNVYKKVSFREYDPN
jgi:hypothetical protein